MTFIAALLSWFMTQYHNKHLLTDSGKNALPTNLEKER